VPVEVRPIRREDFPIFTALKPGEPGHVDPLIRVGARYLLESGLETCYLGVTEDGPVYMQFLVTADQSAFTIKSTNPPLRRLLEPALRAAIGVMDQFDVGAAAVLAERHPQHVEDEVGAHVRGKLPADDHAAEGVDHEGEEVQPSRRRR
jgi:hypothetical protein